MGVFDCVQACVCPFVKSVELVPYMSLLKHAQRRKYLKFRQEIYHIHSQDSQLSKYVFKIAI